MLFLLNSREYLLPYPAFQKIFSYYFVYQNFYIHLTKIFDAK